MKRVVLFFQELYYAMACKFAGHTMMNMNCEHFEAFCRLHDADPEDVRVAGSAEKLLRKLVR